MCVFPSLDWCEKQKQQQLFQHFFLSSNNQGHKTLSCWEINALNYNHVWTPRPFSLSHCRLLSSHALAGWNSFFTLCLHSCHVIVTQTRQSFDVYHFSFFLCQMSAYLEGRTTRLSSTETSRSRSSQEDFLCGEPPAVAAEPQYHPGPLGGGTTHSGRKPGGSSSSDVQYRCDPVEVCDAVER